MTESPAIGRVTTLELFFDLVFVFTITELTTVLFHEPNARGVAQVVLMLGLIWWMYGGYAWMTNAVTAHTAARRVLLLGGMAGYFVLALSIPHAFSDSGLAFGIAYVLIVAVHSILFTRAASVGVVRAILTFAPYNLASAGLVVLGGALGGTAQYVLWAAACLFEWWLTPLLAGIGGFQIAPAHFVERHGLVMIVAIGESVVAVGVGASGMPLDARLAAVAVVGLALSACLWWLYFGGDDQRAEEALTALPESRRPRAGLYAFGYWHIPMLLGIVAVASAARRATADPFAASSWSVAAILAGGVALYLGGDVLFRRELAIGRNRLRAGAAALALATIPLGGAVASFSQISALVVLLGAMFALEAAGPAPTTA